MSKRNWIGRGCVAFVCENATAKILERAHGACVTPAQITEKTERSVVQKILTQNFRRQLQHLANVQERKRPGTIIGNDPAISIEIKFPLDRARRAMEAAQILCGLLENSRGQLSLACLGDVIFGRFHLVDLFIPFSSFRKSTFQKSSDLFRNPRRRYFDHRKKIARATMASRTPSSGLEMANQKETSQPES